jgi:polyisoprenyl-phosphate glycosyltransferase
MLQSAFGNRAPELVGAPASRKLDRRDKVLTLVVPVFNEEEVVEHFVAVIDEIRPAIVSALGTGGLVEFLFVDDGSADATAQILDSLARRRQDIGFLRLSRNFGKEAALAAGLAHARGDAVIPMDVDLQDPPEIIPQMVAAWLNGAKVVNARRRLRVSESWLKRHTAGVFYMVYNRLADCPIHENVGDFRLFDRSVVTVLNEMPERIRFMKGLFSWVGYRQETVEYDRPERALGTSKWRYWSLWNFGLDGITGSTTLPLRVWTYVGLLVFCLTQFYVMIIVGRTLIFGVDVPGYSSIMVAVLTFGALNFVSIGLLGEYIGRIAVEVRQRPVFLVESMHGFPAIAADSSTLESSRAAPALIDSRLISPAWNEDSVV